MEIFIYLAFCLCILAVYINFNIKTKDLTVKMHIKNEYIDSIQNLLDESNREMIVLNQKYDNEIKNLLALQEHNSQIANSNSELKKQLVATQATLKSTVKEEVEKARADSIKRQRSILKGQAMEQLAPFIHPDYQVKDYKFMGDPIDYVIFSGMSEKNDNIEIIFMDIKTGTARLTKIQKQIKKAIEEGRFRFELFKPDQYLDTLEEEEKC